MIELINGKSKWSPTVTPLYGTGWQQEVVLVHVQAL